MNIIDLETMSGIPKFITILVNVDGKTHEEEITFVPDEEYITSIVKKIIGKDVPYTYVKDGSLISHKPSGWQGVSITVFVDVKN
jgi:hypothetical protein